MSCYDRRISIRKHHKHHECKDDWDTHWDHDDDQCDDNDKGNDHHQENHKGSCVRETLEAILIAQRKAKRDDKCKTSCKESINELLGEHRKPKKNTIPFILFCGDCEPFKASGVKVFSEPMNKKKFACITSFVFRIKDLDDNCAVLELLAFKTNNKSNSPCCQINNQEVDDLVKTGICITVDLSCFCAISCMPAVCIK